MQARQDKLDAWNLFLRVYMPGRRRTGSSPLRTSMSAASYRLVIQSFSQSGECQIVPGRILALIEIVDERIANIGRNRADFDAIILMIDTRGQRGAVLQRGRLLRRELEAKEVYG